ncbi:MAG: aldose 1-epimerase [Planctomycetales bacterium]
MNFLALRDPGSGSSARIAVQRGFNCHEFRAVVDGRTIDVIDADPDFSAGAGRPSGHGIPLLFPFPNRIRGGRYVWEGRDYAIDLDEAANDGQGNAIHGFCLDRPWRVTAQSERVAVAEFQLSRDAPERVPGWPADFLIEVRYEIGPAALRADVRIENPSRTPLPWGFGTHPYFRLPLGRDSDLARCLVQADAAECWELVGCLPTGRRVPVPEEKDLRESEYFDVLELDDVLTGLPEGAGAVQSRILDEQAGLEVVQRADGVFRELVVYTPAGRNAVCLEPYTCVTDAINLHARGIDAGWRVLGPGGEFRTWIEIRAGLVLA